MGHRLSITVGFAGTAAAILSAVATARADGDGRQNPTSHVPSFSREIQPILAEHCLKCHGPTTQKADLDLRSPTKMENGGVSGPAIERGASSKSLLYEQISKRVMPPGKAAKLTDEQIRLIGRWIDAGAPADPEADATAFGISAVTLGVSAAGEIHVPSVKGRTTINTCGRFVHSEPTGGERAGVFAACRETEVDSPRDV